MVLSQGTGCKNFIAPSVIPWTSTDFSPVFEINPSFIPVGLDQANVIGKL